MNQLSTSIHGFYKLHFGIYFKINY